MVRFLVPCATAFALVLGLGVGAASADRPRTSRELAPAALELPSGSEQPPSKQLWNHQRVDQIGSDIAGTSVQVAGEDDWNEWAAFLRGDDPHAVLGFTFPFAASSSALYHKIFINPDLWPTMWKAAASGAEVSGASRYLTSVAVMTLTHEAYHLRLTSGDEGRVNACALEAFPDVLTRQFGVQPTITTTNSVPSRVRVRYSLRYHHRWVYRYRWKTVWKTVTHTAPNPVFDEYLADAKDFYTRQPPPYNTGTCS